MPTQAISDTTRELLEYLKDRSHARYIGTEIPEKAKEAIALGLVTVTQGDDWMYDEYIDIALVDQQQPVSKGAWSRMIEYFTRKNTGIPT